MGWRPSVCVILMCLALGRTDGAYAAVIPRWIAALGKGGTVSINGTGETSRDFCYIKNVVQINLLAALTKNKEAINQVYNVALNQRTSLNELFSKLKERLHEHAGMTTVQNPVYQDFRTGDVLHSQADIRKAQQLLGYSPTHTVDEGLDAAMGWYLKESN